MQTREFEVIDQNGICIRVKAAWIQIYEENKQILLRNSKGEIVAAIPDTCIVYEVIKSNV